MVRMSADRLTNSQRAHPSQRTNSTENSLTVDIIVSPTLSSREQVVYIDAVAEIGCDDYLESLTEIIDATRIVYFWLADEKTYFLLDSVETVDALIDQIQTIRIGEHSRPFRPLCSPERRTIHFDNALPWISNASIEKALLDIGIGIREPIEPVPASSMPKFKHILGVRRQTSIAWEDMWKFHHAINVESCIISIIPGGRNCFFCKQWGHIARDCRNIGDHRTSSSAGNPMEDSRLGVIDNGGNNSALSTSTHIPLVNIESNDALASHSSHPPREQSKDKRKRRKHRNETHDNSSTDEIERELKKLTETPSPRPG